MEKAIIITDGLLATDDAKTAHGLIRESRRYSIAGVVDRVHAGKDAGEVLDGRNRQIPIYATVADAMAAQPSYCIVGVATVGGVFPGALLQEVKAAIMQKLSIVNGLHDYLSDHPSIVQLASEYGVQLIDIRLPKKRKDLHFWTGDILQLRTPVVAVLGTDCALGKRTTTRFIMNECRAAGIHAEMIYTGQTGWLQGGEYGFIFDSTLNDFVAGELEHAILSCQAATQPDIILLEGQSALRNPSGPCGSELIISGNAKHVILVHAPRRIYYDHNPAWGKIPYLASEMALIEQLGSRVIAVALNTEHCTSEEAFALQASYQKELGITVMLPLQEGCAKVLPLLQALLSTSKAAAQ